MAVERKTLEDFVSNVIRSRKRFRRELQRLAGYEADLSDILGGRYRSGAHTNAVLGTVLSIVVDFDIPVFFCSDRQAACRFVEGFLLRFHRRNYDDEKKNKKQRHKRSGAG